MTGVSYGDREAVVVTATCIYFFCETGSLKPRTEGTIF